MRRGKGGRGLVLSVEEGGEVKMKQGLDDGQRLRLGEHLERGGRFARG